MRKDIISLVDQQLSKSRGARPGVMDTLGLGQPPAKPGPVITISRQLGSGGRLVAGRLAERLGWSLWDKDLVDAIAKNADVSHRIVADFDEKTISEIDILARTIAGEKEIGRFYYGHHLARVILAVARHGNAIILGRGANFLLTGALNVRIVASEELRIQSLMKYGEMSREEALDRIHESDRERAEFIRRLYNKDIEDTLAYDLVITLDELGIEGVAEIILVALQVKNGIPH
ncbi:MAG: cytidylate kinase-like family protein [Armatimonadota bacterium]